MLSGLLLGLGSKIITNLVEDHGEKLVSKGIEKVTGVKLEDKQELTNEEKQLIIDNQSKIAKLDFEKLKLLYEDRINARKHNVDIQKAKDWLVRNTGSILALFTVLWAGTLDTYILYEVFSNGLLELNPVVTLIAGYSSAKASQVLGFYFSDSKVNADKQRG